MSAPHPSVYILDFLKRHNLTLDDLAAAMVKDVNEAERVNEYALNRCALDFYIACASPVAHVWLGSMAPLLDKAFERPRGFFAEMERRWVAVMNAAAPPLRRLLTMDEAERAGDAFGFNCGPAAICAITGMTPDEVRPFLGDFESKRYTNPTLMFCTLARLGVQFSHKQNRGYPNEWPSYGLARVQWGGPWTKPGVPIAARYRKTHWVASARTDSLHMVFDINALVLNGGWIPFEMWSERLVPWLIKECVPGGDGTWWLTHSLEVVRNEQTRFADRRPTT